MTEGQEIWAGRRQSALTARSPDGMLPGSEQSHRHKAGVPGALGSLESEASSESGYPGYMPRKSISLRHWMQHRGGVKACGRRRGSPQPWAAKPRRGAAGWSGPGEIPVPPEGEAAPFDH